MLTRISNKIKTSLFKMFYYNKFNKVIMYAVPKVYHINRLKIGDNTTINDCVFIHAVGGVRIGCNCVLSKGVTILSTGLSIKKWKERNPKNDRHINRKVIIGDNVWLCSNVTVCSGVEIAPNVVVAAGAVVTKNLLEENVLYAGIPAKKVRNL